MITEQQRNDLFRIYPVLEEVDQDLLTQILSRASLVTLKEGILIFDELQPCNAFPFVISGRIRVFKQSVNGRELSLYHVTEGDVCVVTAGCLLGDEVYNASGLVKEDAELVMMTSGDFDLLLASNIFRKFIFSLISKRIVELMRLVEEVAFHRLDARLAALLVRRGKRINISHQELADELGTVREIITRLLSSFADSGIIKPGRGNIEIIDETALQIISAM